jgi:hypothetical protein
MTNRPSAESLVKTLKAENDPWLDEVFVSLPAFERLGEVQSAILYGEAGSGKTALRLALNKGKGENVFNALWLPEPILEEPAIGTTLARQAIKQVLRSCVESLVFEGNLPERLREPSSHTASALQWLLRKYLPFDPLFYMQSNADHLPLDELQWYSKLMEQPLPSGITEQTSLKDQIHLFLMILRAAKYERLWLMVDGIERWTPHRAGQQVEASLEALLSTLVYFDLPDVAFKFFVPAFLKNIFRKTSGVERHRVVEVELEWSADALQTMLERRLSCALSSKNASLYSLCDGEEFLNWLNEFGGSSPRAWLEFTAPLVMEYKKTGKRLTVAKTREFIRHHPAPLRLDLERQEMWVGKKLIVFNSPAEFRLLEYLYARPGKICSLEHVYYYAQEKLERIPDEAEKEWVEGKTLRKRIDTLIWRVRNKIEPDSGDPLYLVTRRNKGVELLHTEM